MGILITTQALGHDHGAGTLFDGISVTVSSGERIGLIGPNGAGKSTLLKILAGRLKPDAGEVRRSNDLRMAMVAQDPQFEPGQTIAEAVTDGNQTADQGAVDPLVATQMLSQFGLNTPELPPTTLVDTLSGGWKKRVALAQALATEPDLLLLDEPTNHLDLESILWLERLLASRRMATVTVTHDRAFLQKISNKIWELDRRNKNGLLAVEGDFATFLERKAERMAEQEREEAALKNTLRRETEWLRRSPSARSTKQKARIERAHSLAAEVQDVSGRNQTQNIRIDFGAPTKKAKRLVEAHGVAKAYERPVFEDVSLTLTPKTRLGLMGPNGCGKSTLIRVLLGREEPDIGRVDRADDLRVASFEQDRGSLDPEVTLADTVCPDGDFVDYRGQRQHRMGYLARFGFTRAQMDLPIKRLSGGEQARILVARLMLRPANVLVLDEPTNDLDIGTLNVLEQALNDFDGAVLLVSHDRYFIDQVCTELLGFMPTGEPELPPTVTPFADLDQWEEALAQHRRQSKKAAKRQGEGDPSSSTTGKASDAAPKRSKKSWAIKTSATGTPSKNALKRRTPAWPTYRHSARTLRLPRTTPRSWRCKKTWPPPRRKWTNSTPAGTSWKPCWNNPVKAQQRPNADPTTTDSPQHVRLCP